MSGVASARDYLYFCAIIVLSSQRVEMGALRFEDELCGHIRCWIDWGPALAGPEDKGPGGGRGRGAGTVPMITALVQTTIMCGGHGRPRGSWPWVYLHEVMESRKDRRWGICG